MIPLGSGFPLPLQISLISKSILDSEAEQQADATPSLLLLPQAVTDSAASSTAQQCWFASCADAAEYFSRYRECSGLLSQGAYGKLVSEPRFETCCSSFLQARVGSWLLGSVFQTFGLLRELLHVPAAARSGFLVVPSTRIRKAISFANQIVCIRYAQ